MSLGSLEGRFGRCANQRSRHKSVDPAEKYRLSLGITDSQESELFRSIIQPLVLREQNLILEKGELRVEELSSRKSQPMRHPARDIHVKRQNWRLGLPGGPARPEHIAYIIIIAGQLFAKSSRSRAPACLHARQRAPRLGNLLEVPIPASLEEHQLRRSWKAKSANPLIPSSRKLPIIRSLSGAEGSPFANRAFNRSRRPLQRETCSGQHNFKPDCLDKENKSVPFKPLI